MIALENFTPQSRSIDTTFECLWPLSNCCYMMLNRRDKEMVRVSSWKPQWWRCTDPCKSIESSMNTGVILTEKKFGAPILLGIIYHELKLAQLRISLRNLNVFSLERRLRQGLPIAAKKILLIFEIMLLKARLRAVARAKASPRPETTLQWSETEDGKVLFKKTSSYNSKQVFKTSATRFMTHELRTSLRIFRSQEATGDIYLREWTEKSVPQLQNT